MRRLGGPFECALADLDGDLGELSFLCSAAEDRLAGSRPGYPTRARIRPRVSCSAGPWLRRGAGIARWADSVRVVRNEARYAPRSRSLVERVTAERASLADRLRVEQALLAGLIGAPDWQSPSFLHSVAPAAGRETGRIRAHWNDYKRDRHADAEAYERRYLEQMIDCPPGLRPLLTGCGMAAFTTILGWLVGEGGSRGRCWPARALSRESAAARADSAGAGPVRRRDGHAGPPAGDRGYASAARCSSTRCRTRGGCRCPISAR